MSHVPGVPDQPVYDPEKYPKEDAFDVFVAMDTYMPPTTSSDAIKSLNDKRISAGYSESGMLQVLRHEHVCIRKRHAQQLE